LNINQDKYLYLCNKSLMYIIGTKVDYIEDIMGSRFDFSNDQIYSKCGCGTSVNFK
jgi:Fe-S cluster assembly iron-binding protein IscA